MSDFGSQIDNTLPPHPCPILDLPYTNKSLLTNVLVFLIFGNVILTHFSVLMSTKNMWKCEEKSSVF